MSTVGVAIALAAMGWMLARQFVLPSETLFVVGMLSFLLTFFSWASTESNSFQRSLAAYNVATYLAVALFAIVMLVQWNLPRQPFPHWATALLCILGVIPCLVTLYFGLRNFTRWIRGVYAEPTQEMA